MYRSQPLLPLISHGANRNREPRELQGRLSPSKLISYKPPQESWVQLLGKGLVNTVVFLVLGA